MKYLTSFRANSTAARWAVMILLAIAAMVIFQPEPIPDPEFTDQSMNYQYNYCSGVFQFGIANTEIGNDQSRDFAKAVEWFKGRADATGGFNDAAREKAFEDLERFSAAGDTDNFKMIGFKCADIAITERQ